MTTATNNAAPVLNRENSIGVLISTVKAGQSRGAFLIQETALLKKAIDYFNKDVRVKPDFGSSEKPEIVAVNLLIQACQKVNSSPNNPLSIEDAALVYDVFEFWVKEVGQDVASNTKMKEPTASRPQKSNAFVEESDNEDEPQERLITVKGKRPAGL